jgi:nucleoid-associated protein YgaU
VGAGGGAAAGAGPAAATGAASSGSTGGYEDTPPEARGLAGSAADRLAGPDPADPLSQAPSRSDTRTHASIEANPYARPSDRPHDDLDDFDDGVDAPVAGSAAAGAWGGANLADLDDDQPDWASQEPYPAALESRPAAPRPPARAEPRGDGSTSSRDQVSRRKPQDPNELFGPAWERPRRYEAYPSLRTRVGLPALGGVGRVGIGALALFVAALALFFVGPALLGIGSDDNGGGAVATSTPVAEETPTPEPTPIPEPTPTIYVVKKGDTMSKIANKFNITVDELLAANPQIKNPNKISIGDEVTIPVAKGEESS